MTQAEWHRVNGAWVRRSAGVVDPPPDPTTNWSAHVPGRVILGFANSDGGNTQLTYQQGVSFTGPIYERRKFSPQWVSASYINTWLNTTAPAGQVAWLSFKVPNNDWSGVADGHYDDDLDIIKERATARSEKWVVSIVHEPDGNGPPLSEWADMQLYCSAYLASVKSKVAFASIGNGFWFASNQWNPTKFNAAFPQSLIDAHNANGGILAVDSYDSGDPSNLGYGVGRRTSEKMTSFINWARGKGAKSIGFGEFGCHTGEDVRRCLNVVFANSDVVGIVNYFNSGANSRANWLLVPSNYKAPNSAFNGTTESQKKLNYFQAGLAESVNANPAQIPT